MQARGNRAQMIVATKLGSEMGSGPNERGTSRGHIMDAVEASLRRLKTDYIDLYQAHIDDRDTPLEESLRAFDDLIRQGTVRYIGASNYSAWRLATALWTSDKYGYARYETLQPRYNLAARADYERELEPLCQEQGIGVITYSSLASGFFSGKYRAGRDLPTTPRAQGVQRGYMNDKGFAILDAVEGVAREVGATPGQVALAWILARPAITAPIASATSVEQTRELLGAADLHLGADALATLDAASAWRS
jgi:aryl-alcohol dehydrogenase-like predicted oxidoreductase